MLNAGRLRVLREVAYRGSFSGAAEALSYTQSAVSQQIAALELEAGMTLLERHARGVSLTAAGQTLVGHAEGILARLEAAESALSAIAGLRSAGLGTVGKIPYLKRRFAQRALGLIGDVPDFLRTDVA